MSRRPVRPANARACAAVAAALLGAAGCGGGERQGSDDGDRGRGPYAIELEGAHFPANQHIAQRSTFLLVVRNAGDATIPNLAVTLHGFSRRAGQSANADPSVALWTIDKPPAGTETAIEDTWAAGALKPGTRATLRWHVTPIVAGTHKLSYSIAPSLQGSARAQLADGTAPRGMLTVKVDATPAFARVDPRSGRVNREE